MSTAIQNEVACPKCGGATWDNRLTKRNPKAPDYKCRDRACDGAIWPPKNGNAQATRAPAPQSNVKQPLSAGPYIPAIDDGSEALPTEKLNHLFNVYDVCIGHALVVAKRMDHEQIGSSPESTAAIAATLLIAAQRAGV